MSYSQFLSRIFCLFILYNFTPAYAQVFQEAGKESSIQIFKKIPGSAINTQSQTLAVFYNLEASRQSGVVSADNNITPLLSRWVAPAYPVLSAFAASQSSPEWDKVTGLRSQDLQGFVFYNGQVDSPVPIWAFPVKEGAGKFFNSLYSKGFRRAYVDGIISNENSLSSGNKTQNNTDQHSDPFRTSPGVPVYLKLIDSLVFQSQNAQDLLSLTPSLNNNIGNNGPVAAVIDGAEQAVRLLFPQGHVIQAIMLSPQFGQMLVKPSEENNSRDSSKNKLLPRYNAAMLLDVEQAKGGSGVLFVLSFDDCAHAKVAQRALPLRYKTLSDVKEKPELAGARLRSHMIIQRQGCSIGLAITSPKNAAGAETAENALYTLMAYRVFNGVLSFIAPDME